jgi:hypothetical protein
VKIHRYFVLFLALGCSSAATQRCIKPKDTNTFELPEQFSDQTIEQQDLRMKRTPPEPQPIFPVKPGMHIYG